jgi:hypothetical protein
VRLTLVQIFLISPSASFPYDSLLCFFCSENTSLFPFFDNFCRLQKKVESPLYLADEWEWDMSDVFKYKSQEKKTKPVKFEVSKDWPVDELETTLDAGQVEALKHLLTSRVALVQGPPGTGKTYVTLKAAAGLFFLFFFFFVLLCAFCLF